MAKPVKVVHWYLLDDAGRRTGRRFTSKNAMMKFVANNPQARLKEHVVGWYAKVWNSRTKKQEFQTFRKKAEADAWINSTKTAIKEGRKKDDRLLKKMTCSELLDQYLSEIEGMVSRGKQAPSTMESKTYRVDTLKDFFGEYYLSEISDDLVYDYAKMRVKAIQPGSVKKELDILSHALNISSTAFKIKGLDNWVSKAKPAMKSQHLVSSDKERDRRLAPHEEKAILATATRSIYCRAAFGFAAETAIRRTELSNASRFQIIYDVLSPKGRLFQTESYVRASKYVFKNPECRLVSRINRHKRYFCPEQHVLHISADQSKTGVARDIYLTEKAIKFIKSVPASACGRLFPMAPNSFTQWLGRILDKNPDIIDLHWHDLRHEGTTRYFELGWGIEEVQLSTGHADYESLQRYVQKTTKDVIAQKVLKKNGL